MVAEEVGRLAEVEGKGVVRRGGQREFRDGVEMVGDEEFTRLEAGQLVGELGGGIDFGEAEFAGAEVEPSEAGRFFVRAKSGKVVVAVFFQSEVIESACAEDAGDFATDEFAGSDLSDLVADGDAFAGLDQFCHVGSGTVVGDPAHGNVAALGQGDVEEGGRFAGVVEKHFVKVSEAEEEEGVGGELAADVLVLAHHGGELRNGHRWLL